MKNNRKTGIKSQEFVWQGIAIRISFERNWLGMPPSELHPSHLEINVLRPAKEPLPITETGYRSHFVAPAAVDAAGGPLAYVRDWIDEAAQMPAWRKLSQKRRQLELF